MQSFYCFPERENYVWLEIRREISNGTISLINLAYNFRSWHLPNPCLKHLTTVADFVGWWGSHGFFGNCFHPKLNRTYIQLNRTYIQYRELHTHTHTWIQCISVVWTLKIGVWASGKGVLSFFAIGLFWGCNHCCYFVVRVCRKVQGGFHIIQCVVSLSGLTLASHCLLWLIFWTLFLFFSLCAVSTTPSAVWGSVLHVRLLTLQPGAGVYQASTLEMVKLVVWLLVLLYTRQHKMFCRTPVITLHCYLHMPSLHMLHLCHPLHMLHPCHPLHWLHPCHPPHMAASVPSLHMLHPCHPLHMLHPCHPLHWLPFNRHIWSFPLDE